MRAVHRNGISERDGETERGGDGGVMAALNRCYIEPPRKPDHAYGRRRTLKELHSIVFEMIRFVVGGSVER